MSGLIGCRPRDASTRNCGPSTAAARTGHSIAAHTAEKKERMRRPYFYREPASSCNRRQFNRQLSLAFITEGSGEPSAEKLRAKRPSVLAYATQSNVWS